MKKIAIILLTIAFALSSGSAWAALTKTHVSQLYIGVFGRASEGEGNSYWQTDPRSTSMTATANIMLNTAAAKTYFGSTLDSNQLFIEHIYVNTLGKTFAEDPVGVNYWVSELDGGKTKGEVIAALITAAQDSKNAGAAQDRFNNKVSVSNHCADTIAEYTDLDTFTGFISSVTDDAATVTSAQGLIDTESSSSSSGAADSQSCQVNLKPKIEGSLTDLTCKITTTCEGPLDGILCFVGGNESQCETDILDTGTSSSIRLSNITSLFADDFLLPDGVEEVKFLYCDSGTISIYTPRTCSDGTAPKTMAAQATNCTDESISATYTGDFSGSTTQTLGCSWSHTVSGSGSITMEGSDNATFEFTGTDIVKNTGPWPECGDSSSTLSFSGPMIIYPDGRIEASGTSEDASIDFQGTVNESLGQITGTLTIDSWAFDASIVGAIILTRQ